MNKTGRFLYRGSQWLNRQTLKALDRAYESARIIMSIEDQHFDGQKIQDKCPYGHNNVMSLLITDN